MSGAGWRGGGTWVGIGGATASGGLLQARTIAHTPGMGVGYVAFVDDYANTPLYVQAPVAAGDTLQVMVAARDAAQVADLTQGWTTGPLDVAGLYSRYTAVPTPPRTRTPPNGSSQTPRAAARRARSPTSRRGGSASSATTPRRQGSGRPWSR